MSSDSRPTPEECPEPFWHETHRYCPICTWKEDEEPNSPTKDQKGQAGEWPLTLVRRGAKVPDDGTRWWQELPQDHTAEGLGSVGYQVVEVVPTSTVKGLVEALENAEEFIERVTDWTGSDEDERDEELHDLRTALSNYKEATDA